MGGQVKSGTILGLSPCASASPHALSTNTPWQSPKAQPWGLCHILLNPGPFLQFYQCLNLAGIISCLDYCHDLLTELSASYLDLLHFILYIFVKVNFLKWRFNHVTPRLGNTPSLSPTYVINNKFLIWPLPSLGELLSIILQPELSTSAIPDDFDPL